MAMVAAAALLGCTAVLGIVIGSTSVGIDDVLALAFGEDAEQTAANVIWNIRLPRVLAALLAGAALAQAGALIQAALDNPLASPSIIGVNAGSGFFVLLAACTFPSAFGLAPVAAFLGALCVAGLIFAVAGLGGSSRLTVVLAGMAFTSIFTAGMNTILIVNPDAYVGASGFLIGGLSGVKLDELIIPSCAICAVLALGLAICCFAAARDGLDKTIQHAIDGSCAPGLFPLVSVPTIIGCIGALLIVTAAIAMPIAKTQQTREIWFYAMSGGAVLKILTVEIARIVH